MDGWIDEIYVRPNVRRRGIAGEVLTSLSKALLGAGLKGLHAKVSKENSEIVKIYESKGFVLDKNFQMMKKILLYTFLLISFLGLFEQPLIIMSLSV